MPMYFVRLMALPASQSRSCAAPWTCRTAGTARALHPTRPRSHISESAISSNTTSSSADVAYGVADVWATEDDLHPVSISKAATVQYLQTQLVSRRAAKQGVQAILLNGPYLPSQLDIISDLASKLQLYTSCFISRQQLHVVVSQQPELQHAEHGSAGDAVLQPHPELTWIELLSSGLSANVQPLPEGRLDAAQDREQRLTQQLRLFSPVDWSSALQQKLLTRKRVQSVLAVRSLMPPAALSSVRELVSKVGLHLLEIDRELPSGDSGARRRSSSSTGGSRRRIKPCSTSATTANRSESGSCNSTASSTDNTCKRELVLLISAVPIEPGDLDELAESIAPTAFTDYTPGCLGAAKAEDKQGQGAWWKWKLDLGRWFVREPPSEA